MPGRYLVLALLWSSLARTESPGGTLAVTNTVVQRSEDGNPITPSFKFLPGEFVYFTFQIAGFAKTPATETQPGKLSVSYNIALLDEAERALAPAVEDKVNVELNAEDKDWTPKRRASFQLPSFVAAGAYRVHVAVKDEIGKRETTADIPFQIGGTVVPASAALGVQSFGFFRSANDREPLEVAAYQAGDNIFARFQIVGFKKGDENRYQLTYKVGVLRPDGKPFLRDSPDVELDGKSFYPAPYLPAEIDLTTGKDAAKGQYRLVVTVHDRVSQATATYPAVFTIE